MIKDSTHPIWAMAFRPLYLLAALYGALSILLWGFGYQGTAQLPAFFWHAHEMIWGYAGAIVVAFLLTAVATWTQQPAVRGKPLIVLTSLWLLARLFAFIPHAAWLSGITGTLFYGLAAYLMGLAVVRSRNQRNYIAVFALLLFGLSHLGFHYSLQFATAGLRQGLFAGLVLVAGFIGLIGTRIIPFFTSRRLNTPQIATPTGLAYAPLVLPMVMAVCMSLQIALPLAALCGITAGAIGLIQTGRWLEKGVWQEPMLWILHVGYALTALGLIIMGIGQWQASVLSMGVHLVAVGGIGLLTIGMMTRTALGHTGRPLYPAPFPMTWAFWLMLAATLTRTVTALSMSSSPTAYQHGLKLSALFFAASLLLFVWRYFPWLTQARADGKAG